MGDTEHFVHRYQYGQHDSICRTCFQTVASARLESDLALQEQKHVCDSVYLANLKRAMQPKRMKDGPV